MNHLFSLVEEMKTNTTNQIDLDDKDYTVQPSTSGQNKRKAEDDCYCPPPKHKPLMPYLFDIANGNLTEVASMTLNNMPGQGQKWLNIVFKDE